MKVVGISLPKTAYKPGEAVVATVTVQREIETGGVLYFYTRRAGQVWQAGPVTTVGNTGLGVPDIFASGQLQKVTSTLTLPSDASGNYQIGVREQSEVKGVSARGVASFTVEPSTPVPSIGQTTVTFIPNRSDASDVVVYIEGSPAGILAAWGYTAVIKSGAHTISAKGSMYSSEPVKVNLAGGTTVKIPITLVSNTLIKSSTPAFEIGANFQTYALLGIAAAVGLAIVFLGKRGDD